MKNYFKGLLSGFFIIIILLSVPVLAQNIQLILNGTAINVNGIDRANWTEDYVRDDGSSVPFSISYDDTTYLPIRKIAEFNNQEIYWNGDTKTVSFTAKPKENSQYIISEKSDVYGNVWKYYIFKTLDGKTYLGVQDEKRGYERVYQIMGATQNDKAVKVTEDGIYFAKVLKENSYWYSASIYKITFLNDINSQDGSEISKINNNPLTGSIIFYEDYFFYSWKTLGTNDHSVLTLRNLFTEEEAYYHCSSWWSLHNLSFKNGNDDNIVLNCNLTYDAGSNRTEICEMTFSKSERSFSKKVIESYETP